MSGISNIKNYILFLKHSCGLSVTLHPHESENLIFPSELISFNIHDNPYCIYVKSHPLAQRHCIDKQCKVFEKCKGGSFCGTCYAGVTEYVYPISNGAKTVGFISVSGYGCGNSDSFIKAASEKYSISAEGLKKTYGVLKKDIPKKEDVDVLLTPLCNMLELAYIKSADSRGGEQTLEERIVRYVKQNHTLNITIADVCREFSCSTSLVSHNFKRHTGMSFREYLAHLRIDDAKIMLKHSKLTVTEIALSVGFSDSNYFSNVFKKSVGVSPLAYRKR